jgi:hypothetical protein
VIHTEIRAKASDLTIGLADKNNCVRFTSCAQSQYSTSIEIVENESNRIFEVIAPVCDFCQAHRRPNHSKRNGISRLFTSSQELSRNSVCKCLVIHFIANYRVRSR